MVAIVLACCSAASFGLMTTVIRISFRRYDDPFVGSLALGVIGLAVTAVVALVALPYEGGATLSNVAPFLLAGLLAPGTSQIR